MQLENSSEIAGELQANQPLIAENAAKSMKGKYDGRRNNGKYKTKANRGPKPFFERHLGRNTAAKLFRQVNVHEQCLQLLSEPDARLRFEVIKYIWNRLEGTPFTATNPAEAGKQQGLLQDNRLQVAIQQLIVEPHQRKQKKLKANTPELTGEVTP